MTQQNNHRNQTAPPQRPYVPQGGLPPQNQLMTDRAVFTESYAVIPRGVLSDIVTSLLPDWTKTRAWILARPMNGFAETFTHYIVEVEPAGGSDRPDPDPAAQSVLYIVKGTLDIQDKNGTHALGVGSYAYIPAGHTYTVKNTSSDKTVFHWIRKRYEAVDGVSKPSAFFTHEDKAETRAMPDTEGHWCTTRFVDPNNISHDMHVNLVSFEPGACIPFAETHVMEHGIYVLEGKAVYRLNRDWVEVEAGDFMWLRAFCPQGCYAGGPGRFRYLLYKDVNRHPSLTPLGRLR